MLFSMSSVIIYTWSIYAYVRKYAKHSKIIPRVVVSVCEDIFLIHKHCTDECVLNTIQNMDIMTVRI